MPEQLQFSFRRVSLVGSRPRRYRQLTVAASMSLYDAAARKMDGLTDEINGLASTGDRGYGVIEILDDQIIPGGFAFAVRDSAIGRSEPEDQDRFLASINNIIGAFVAANNVRYSDGRLPPHIVHLESYKQSAAPGSNDYHMAVLLQVPSTDPEKLARLARNEMAATTRTLLNLGGHAIKFHTDSIGAKVDLRSGVFLKLSTDSNIGIPADEFITGEPNIRLSGNNVVGPMDPYVLLHGCVMLAMADRFARR